MWAWRSQGPHCACSSGGADADDGPGHRRTKHRVPRAMTDFELAHEYETVKLWRRGGAAKIELNRPETMNAWNRQFGDDLRDAVTKAGEDDDVRAVLHHRRRPRVLLGRRPQGDGHERRPHARGPPRRPHDAHRALPPDHHGIRRMPKPVVAAVNGPAVGIGLSLALAADLVVAKRVGVLPAGLREHRPRARRRLVAVRRRRASGSRARPRWRCSASGSRRPQALEWGLINRVFADDAFDAEVGALLERLADGPDAVLRGHQAPAQRLALPRAWTSSWSSRPTSSRRWRRPATSPRASWRSSRSAQAAFGR